MVELFASLDANTIDLGAGGQAFLIFKDGATWTSGFATGGPGATLLIFSDPTVIPVKTSDIPGFTGTLLSLTAPASHINVNGLNPAYWGGAGVPENVLEAVDRIAAVVSVGGGSPIP